MRYNVWFRAILALIVLITISSILKWSSLPLDNTTFWWIVQASFLTIFVVLKLKYSTFFKIEKAWVVKCYLVWNSICIIRGVFIAENYWEWKNLVGTSMSILLPLIVFVFQRKVLVRYIYFYWLRICIPLFFVLSPTFTYSDAVGRYLMPISLLLLFFPIIPFKWKLILLSLSLLVFLSDLNARSNVIKFIVPLLLGLVAYLPSLVSSRKLKIARMSLLLMPFLLLFLGISGVFNIFKMDDYISGDYSVNVVENGKVEKGDLIADTRTFLYVEVVQSAIKYNYYLFGRTPARGNESDSFGWKNKELLKISTNERFANEVSILNVFTWTGIVGVFLYFILFASASHLAINRSKNNYVKIVGVYIAFRWAYSWVEDFNIFDVSYLFLWILLGVCFSREFRSMDDIDFKNWFQLIFKEKKRQPSIRS